MELTTIQKIAVFALPLIFAVTVHEYAHGWVAKLLGDPTASSLGRLTLNPIPHIDIIGTIVLPIAMFLFTNFLFGWAKPVPIDTRNLKKPLSDMALIAIAGPISNALMAIGWGVIVGFIGKALYPVNQTIGLLLILMAQAGVIINISLMVINLLPLLPLDGGRIVTALLPKTLAIQYAKTEPYGFIILIILLTSGFLASGVHPLISFLTNPLLP